MKVTIQLKNGTTLRRAEFVGRSSTSLTVFYNGAVQEIRNRDIKAIR